MNAANSEIALLLPLATMVIRVVTTWIGRKPPPPATYVIHVTDSPGATVFVLERGASD
jgi:hypothetical protein